MSVLVEVCLLCVSLHTLFEELAAFKGAIDRLCLRLSFVGYPG